MRLLWKALIAASLFGALAGCHTAGICDSECGCGCDSGCSTGSCGCGGALDPAPAPSPIGVQTAPQALPKGDLTPAH